MDAAPTIHKAEAARTLGLRYVSSRSLRVTRRRCGRGYAFIGRDGRAVRDARAIRRMRELAIPPAWTNVRVAGDDSAHIQAVGTDEAGRRQYIYHPRWEAVREAGKAVRLLALGESLTAIRAGVQRDLGAPAGSRRLALAVGAAIVDSSVIRIGTERHHRRTGACGAVTLRRSHLRLNGRKIRLRFPAKGGKVFRCEIEAPRLIAPVRRLSELGGERLLAYRNGGGALGHVRAEELNAYLSELAGRRINAKDFRTFQATARAADLLAKKEPAASRRGRERQIALVTRKIAEQLGNTPAVARASYIHPVVVSAFTAGDLGRRWNRSGRRPEHVEPHEAALTRLLRDLLPSVEEVRAAA